MVSFLLFMVLPSFSKFLTLFFFVPFIIVTMYKKTLPSTLISAFLIGLMLDLLSSSPRLGIYSLDFCVTSMIIYPLQRNFFSDNLSTLPLMTWFFSLISTLILSFLIYFFDSLNIFSPDWFYTDMMVMPVIDALYALFIFVLPSLFFEKKRLKGEDYFLNGRL